VVVYARRVDPSALDFQSFITPTLINTSNVVTKKKKFSGGFRGVNALESQVTESVEFDTVRDEIRRWSSLSEDEYQVGIRYFFWEVT
jgi:hypothetical protein